MYLYFDRNRVLKEIINNDEISVGDSGTQIYVYVEELEPNSCWVRFKLPDGSLFPLSAEMEVTKIARTTVPYNKKRDLKFFEYGKTYKFLVIDLTTTGDNAYNILANTGNVSCTIRVNDDGLKALGLVVFDVAYSTEASANVLEYDGYVSIAQFNYLLDLIERYEDVVVQTNDISGLDPDDYEVGQVILESRSYSGIYQGTLYVVQIEGSTKYFDELKIFHLKVKYLLPDSIIFGDEDNSSDQASIGYGNHKLNINVGSHTLSLNSSGVLTIDSNELATQDYVANNFVDLTTMQTVNVKKVFSDFNLYNSVITTNSKNYFAKAGVTTNQFVTYQLPFSYSEIGNTTVTLAIENLVGLQTLSQGTLPAGNLAKVQRDNAVIKRNNKYFYKITSPTGQLVFNHIEVSQSDNVYTIKDERITITTSNGHWEYTTTSYNAYSKDGVDNLIATIKANTLQQVDITTYPTLNSFLASTGEEGIIYLYPIDTSDESKGYYQYIWENSAYISLGTTQIDLSGYVEKTQTIAGIDLQDNISKAEMLTALGLSSAYTSESISGLTTMAELRTFVDNVNLQGEHCFFDLHTYIDDAYVCLVHCWTENGVKYCFVQDLLNQKTYGDYAGYQDNTTISAYLSGNSMANIKTIKITDSTTTLSDIATLLQEINALGDYVMFDVSGITNAMYLTTIYINGTYYRVFDSVTGRTASGTSTTSLSETLKSVIEGGVVAPSTWEEIHNLIAEGNGSLVYQAGDELDVKFFNSFTATSSNTNLTLSVNRDTFVMKTDMATATYEFTYNSNRSTWVLNEQDVDITEYGITITGTPANNNKITIAVVVDTIPYIVMGNDQETPSDNDSFSHSLTLRRKYCRDTGLVFDPKEAFFYNGTGAVMPAGTYNFLLGGHSWVSADVGKYFQFTLTQDLPIGGQLVWQQENNVSLVNAKIKSYASALDTTEIETCVMTEGQGGTYLGVINNGKPTSATTGYNATYNDYLNQCQRALLGNNDYEQSNIRQMLNSDEEKGTYAQPQNGWDRLATYVLSGNNGFLYDIDPHIKQYVAECNKATETVTFTQTSPINGGRKQSNEKVWLMSREEIQSESASEYNSYSSYTYYHNLLGSTYGDWRTDTRFILTNSAGTAQYYFLRSPYTSNGHHVRRVVTGGGVYYGLAHDGGCRVECFAIK